MLLCAHCGIPVDEAYYGTCAFVPYCCQQHARQDQARHDCTFLEKLMEHMVLVYEDLALPPTAVGAAFKGHIPEMLGFIRYCPNEVKMFLLALFPVCHHNEVRALLNKDYAGDCVLHYFNRLEK